MYTSSTRPTLKYEPIRGLGIYIQGKAFSLPSNKIDSIDNNQTKQVKKKLQRSIINPLKQFNIYLVNIDEKAGDVEKKICIFFCIILYKSHKSRNISISFIKLFEAEWLDGTILPDYVTSITLGHRIERFYHRRE